jgi:hypothetical protein
MSVIIKQHKGAKCVNYIVLIAKIKRYPEPPPPGAGAPVLCITCIVKIGICGLSKSVLAHDTATHTHTHPQNMEALVV